MLVLLILKLHRDCQSQFFKILVLVVLKSQKRAIKSEQKILGSFCFQTLKDITKIHKWCKFHQFLSKTNSARANFLNSSTSKIKITKTGYKI